MEIKTSYYCEYLNTRASDIPMAALVEITDEFSANAKFYMSSDVDESTTEKINTATVDLLKNSRFKYLPLHLISEAYHRGSLGDLGGTTRFTLRNIYTWLSSMTDKLQVIETEKKTREDESRRAAAERLFKQDRHNANLFGTAMYIKIALCYSGAIITGQEYDRCSLDKIVDLLKRGYKSDQIHPSMIL